MAQSANFGSGQQKKKRGKKIQPKTQLFFAEQHSVEKAAGQKVTSPSPVACVQEGKPPVCTCQPPPPLPEHKRADGCFTTPVTASERC